MSSDLAYADITHFESIGVVCPLSLKMGNSQHQQYTIQTTTRRQLVPTHPFMELVFHFFNTQMLIMKASNKHDPQWASQIARSQNCQPITA